MGSRPRAPRSRRCSSGCTQAQEVRLACQLRPTSDLAFVPLLSPYATTLDAYQAGAANSGVERYLVIMFVDMRGSSRLAERRLPFDTVFIINQFLNAVSHAVLDAGGQPNQVLGDGLLALFGMSVPPGVACRQAIAASAAIADRVGRLNTALAHALVEPIRFGVGIHAGVTVAGAIGYERHAQFTVIGDPVNVAARLQDLTKAMACEVLMSEEVYERAGFAAGRPPRPRGRDARTRGERESPQRRASGGSDRPDRGAGDGGVVSGSNRRAVPRTQDPQGRSDASEIPRNSTAKSSDRLFTGAR